MLVSYNKQSKDLLYTEKSESKDVCSVFVLSVKLYSTETLLCLVCEWCLTPCFPSSWYLYMHDKLNVSGTALDSARAADKEDDTPRAETLKPVRKAFEEAEDGERKASAGSSPLTV